MLYCLVVCCSVSQCVAALELSQKGVFHTKEVLNSDPFPGPDLEFMNMGWLRLVGSLKLQVSFAKEPYKTDDILQKRPKILRSLLIVATPYHVEESCSSFFSFIIIDTTYSFASLLFLKLLF